MADEELRQLGEVLRAQRESLGLSIKDVEEQTKIRSTYIMAMESGNDNISPGKAYFRVFLKSYADFLGLDGLEFSRRYQSILEEKSGERASSDRVVTGEELNASRARRKTETKKAKRRKQTLKVVNTLIIVAVVILAVWGVSRGLQYYFGEKMPEPNTENGYNDIPEPLPQPEPEPEPEETVKVIRTDPSKELSVFETNKSPLEIILKTSAGSEDKCWIRVESDGEVVAEKTLGPNESIEASAEKELRVRAGRPWVLTIIVNGEDLGVGGEFGPAKDLVFTYKEDL
ncbi:MAG TPA: DUF4115 domain-containing protein [Bacillota bacterium]|nr:helix-turn-helix domain-containing protein [Candidatus Fermentithermobacillaceae bacterium]HOB29957.1 DUF4115 domain-containing protein [Bacillota bacterium]HOK63827.1 DUF4115 domain-containing protein [Bacillota bacterium]HOL11485.1 DUF4115 domain-containing protein [Bacillota bacterium]HOQ03215.1 DUF4115 domain-containing protein [Bacillota bacterium]